MMYSTPMSKCGGGGSTSSPLDLRGIIVPAPQTQDSDSSDINVDSDDELIHLEGSHHHHHHSQDPEGKIIFNYLI
jgi:hypothetical protein